MSAQDRYAFAISLLDGDRQARKILADLLEEDGERGLAQWALQGSNRDDKRLELAIMLLPCAIAIDLGVDMIRRRVHSRSSGLLFGDVSDRISRWRTNRLSDAEMLTYCEAAITGWCSEFDDSYTRPTAKHSWQIEQEIRRILESVRHAISAKTKETPQFESSSKRLICLIASGCRYRFRRDDRSEIDWQVNQTKSLFENLLGLRESSSPE
jgi:hypothetical protein